MKNNFGKHALEPVWHPCDRLRRHALSAAERDWLVNSSSLTQRLQQACTSHFDVEVISQRLEKPMLSEARALGRPPRETALVRQVYLRCAQTPWVFARTVIPLASLQGSIKKLSMLGNKPLGAVLFADPRMQRQPLEIARIRPRHRLYQMAGSSDDKEQTGLWGRRSVFTLQGAPLLVSEFFLPELFRNGGHR